MSEKSRNNSMKPTGETPGVHPCSCSCPWAVSPWQGPHVGWKWTGVRGTQHERCWEGSAAAPELTVLLLEWGNFPPTLHTDLLQIELQNSPELPAQDCNSLWPENWRESMKRSREPRARWAPLSGSRGTSLPGQSQGLVLLWVSLVPAPLGLVMLFTLPFKAASPQKLLLHGDSPLGCLLDGGSWLRFSTPKPGITLLIFPLVSLLLPFRLGCIFLSVVDHWNFPWLDFSNLGRFNNPVPLWLLILDPVCQVGSSSTAELLSLINLIAHIFCLFHYFLLQLGLFEVF